jgi:hypothetical protein
LGELTEAMHIKHPILRLAHCKYQLFLLLDKKSDASHTYAINLIGYECKTTP